MRMFYNLTFFQNETVCTEVNQTNCETPVDVANKLDIIIHDTKIVTKKDAKAVADIIENVANGVDNVQNKTEVDSVRKINSCKAKPGRLWRLEPPLFQLRANLTFFSISLSQL